jgi:methionyl-tRNA synthetase
MSERRFYVTTPIYYVNDEPHIGHAYTTVLADVLARFHRLHGDTTHFLTGTDEHGQKIVEAAAENGHGPREHCDLMAARFRETWRVLQISHDDFIRTTELRHETVVQRILAQLYERGEIYQDTYEGLYCVPDERFWTAKDVVDGNCPDCGRPVVPLSEKNYFFRMSRYQEWLLQHIADNPGFIQPHSRRNEVLGFLKKPLGDLCISRPAARLSWGIPLPFDPEYVTYVWFDALLNYYSAVEGMEAPGLDGWWPATCQLIAKDILTTHAVYWPTMLRAAGLELPTTILAHGWWTHAGRKMSKSLGNVVHPIRMSETYGADGFRFFLMRDMVVGLDSDFSEPALIARINSDLANDLGNCLNRVERMIHAHFADRIPAPSSLDAADEGLAQQARLTIDKVFAAMDEVRIHQAIEETMELVRAVNRYLEVKAPWKAVKDGGPEAIAATLATAAEAIRLAVSLLIPVMPGKCGEALYRLGMIDAPEALVAGPADPAWLRWGGLRPGAPIRPGGPLFPRIETATDTPG